MGIIDLSHLVHSKWYSYIKNEEMADQADFDEVAESVFRWVESFSICHERTIIAVDAPPYNRKQLSAEYKANRKEKSANLIQTIRYVEKALSKDHDVQKHQGYEADDVIASAVREASAAGWSSIILTRDKDLFQLVDANCSILSTDTSTLYGPQEVYAKMGVRPDQILDYLCLVGDASDGICGVPGVGVVTAKKLLKEYENVIGVLDAAERGLLTPKLNQTLCDEEVRQTMVLAGALATLEDNLPVTIDLPSVAVKNEEDDGMLHDDNLDETYQAPALRGSVSQMERDSTEVLVKHEAPTGGPPALPTLKLRPGLMVDRDQFTLLSSMAKYFHDSGLYRKVPSQAAIFTIMELGLELGISPQIALNNFHIIEGRPSPSAHFLIAMAKRDANCEYLECVEVTDSQVTWETVKRRGYTKAMRFTYSMEDAKRDALKWANGGKNCKAMLRKTSGSQAARLWYPEACSGLYSAEEMGFVSGTGDE